MSKATPKDVRKARAWLHSQSVPEGTISPMAFASTAHQLGAAQGQPQAAGFPETWKVVAALVLATQGRGPFPRSEGMLTGGEVIQ